MVLTGDFVLAALRWLGHRDAVPYGARDRLLRLCCNPDRAPDKRFEADFFGLRYSGSLASYIDWIVFFYGAYEKGMLFLLRDLLRARGAARPVFVDVGANTGHHALFMSRHAASVHAFEPYGEVRDIMVRRLAENGIANVTVHPVGLGAADGRRPFFAPTTANAGTGTFVAERQEITGNVLAAELTVCAADAYFAAHGIDRVDLVKIDVEGLEAEVLAGMKAVVARDRPAIVMEYSGTTRARLPDEAALSALVGDGYRLFSIAGPVHARRLAAFDAAAKGEDIATLPAAMAERLGLAS